MDLPIQAHLVEFVSHITGHSTRMQACSPLIVKQISSDRRCRTAEKALWSVWGRYLPFNNLVQTDAGPRWEIPVQDGVWYVYTGHHK